jgi:spoIIIJ-associated protein
MIDRDHSIEMAQKFLEDVLSFFGLNTVVHSSVDEDVIELSVPSTHLNGFLIGQHGETLRALQALVSTMLKSSEAELNRVNIDVADYKKQRADNLREQLADWVKTIRENKEPMALKPMNSADRRTIHKGLEDYSDVTSHSEGEARDRHIVLELVK